jgi:hypothetical protein
VVVLDDDAAPAKRTQQQLARVEWAAKVASHACKRHLRFVLLSLLGTWKDAVVEASLQVQALGFELFKTSCLTQASLQLCVRACNHACFDIPSGGQHAESNAHF